MCVDDPSDFGVRGVKWWNTYKGTPAGAAPILT